VYNLPHSLIGQKISVRNRSCTAICLCVCFISLPFKKVRLHSTLSSSLYR